MSRITLAAIALIAFALTTGYSHEGQAIGLLIPSEQSLPPLAIKSHRVNIQVTDQAAVTRVEQVFVNHTDRQLEATFYFPVPKGSTVSDFSLWINGRKTPGAVLERSKARAIYERIVRRTQDPGLVEYIDGQLFQARIFPVPARGEQKVEIAYASVIGRAGSTRRLIYPLKTGRKAARLMEDFTLVANISSNAPLKAVYSPTHRVDVSRASDHRVTVGLEEDAADLERDFLLYLGTSDDDVGMSILTYDPDGKGGEDGYYLMILAPKLEVDEDDIPGKTVTFVVDTSGSMAGEKMEQARAALAQCIRTLRPRDHFNVVRFSTGLETLFTRPTPATPDAVRHGLAFASRLEAAGGTAIDDALETALASQAPDDGLHFVIFMTDGRPTVGEMDVQAIIRRTQARNAQRARIFTYGVGWGVNTTLLDQIATGNGGISDYVRPNEDIKLKVTDLVNRISYPVMADLKLEYNTSGVFDVYPKRLPDLFRGGQVVVMGRTRGALPSGIDLHGRFGDEEITLEFDEIEGHTSSGDATVAHDFIPKLWATRKVGYLLEEIRGKGEIPELKAEVIRLARAYGLVTPYTSYLAVDDEELEGSPRPGVATRGFEAERRRRESALKNRKGFDFDSGADAVESSIAANELKTAGSASEAENRATRYIDGKLFIHNNGVWQEAGVDPSRAKRIKYGSKEYFDLLEERPALKRKMSIGRNVDFEDAGEAFSVF
ncbi:MAG: trypsin [Myxococcales bacterium]|nr:trypsin [Myxococcales bacterium]